MTVVDLFAGPGGWDLAAQEMGIRPLGIEWDDAACATRHAAGLWTLQADVADLDPLDYGPCDGLIASPPCQAFSMAGKGAGRRDVEAIQAVAHDLAGGRDTRREAAGQLLADGPEGALFGFEIADARSLLVVEPLRWALALRPQWIAFEQVVPVLPLWEMFAGFLRDVGYETWTGVLSAEEYGVPQTRKRAILLASLDGPVAAPVATHTAYRKGKPRQVGDRLPWVSMADALGWDADEQIGFPRANDRDDGGEYRERDLRPAAEPAFALTEKARSWQRWTYVASRPGSLPGVRVDEPAPTIAYGHAACDAAWIETDRVPELAGERRDDDGAVRVTEEEAAILQSFPAGFPWQGTRSKMFEQIGNAIPPLLAGAALGQVVGRSRCLECGRRGDTSSCTGDGSHDEAPCDLQAA